jgi:hypothetical protein
MGITHLFIRALIGEHLNGFQCGTAMNSAVMDICI